MTRRTRGSLTCLLAVVALGAAVGSVNGQTDPNPGPNSTQPAAFTGLLQMPEANLFTGSAATSIPIDLPPGRKSLGMKLALQYVSGGGPSLYGYGWDLPLGRIERSTRFGVIGCGNQNHVDDFVLSLPTSTLEFRRAGGIGIPRVQESFIKIVWNSGSNSWTAWDKGGTKFTFGATFESRSGTDANTADPSFANCANFSAGTPISYTFSWALTHIEDTNGNDVDITYAKNASGVVHPISIEYGGTTGNQIFRVEFTWPPNSRPAEDRLVNGLGGFRAELDTVLSDITVKYLKVTPNETIRRYHFDYDVTRVGRRTFLEGVTLYNGATPSQALTRYDGLPATTEFVYHDNHDADPSKSRFGFDQGSSFNYSVPWGGGRFAAPDGDADLDIFDITGDGIADMVKSNPCDSGAQTTWSVRRGSKAGYAATAQTWTFTTPGGCIRDGQPDGDYTRTKRDTVDLTGDGIPDYIDGSGTGAWMVHKGYVTATGGGFLTATAWSGSGDDIRRSFLDQSSGTLSIDQADILDINGDGRPDHVRATIAPDIWLVRYNLGGAFSADLYFLTRNNSIRRSQGGDETLGVYDMNGDGLPDQVAVNAAGDGLDVYYNSGQRIGVKQGSTVVGSSWPVPLALRPQALGSLDLRNSTTDGAGYTYVKRQLLDVNGDGLPDLVYAPGSGDWVVALNRGNGFSDAQTWRIVPETGQNNLYIRQVSGDWTIQDTYDYDGDGLLDHVSFGNQGGSSLEVRPRRNLGGAWCESFAGVVCNDQPGSTQTHVIPNVSTDPMNPGRGQRRICWWGRSIALGRQPIWSTGRRRSGATR